MDTIEKKISLKKRFIAFFASMAVLAGGVVAGVQANPSSDMGKLVVTSDQPGAQLQILDASGNVVIDDITTTGKAQEFSLPAGEGYKLHEVKAPEGFKAKTGDWTFSIVPEYQESTQVVSPAKQLPTSVSAYNDGLPTTGAYHTNDGMFVFCVDASDEFPPRGNYSAQDFNGFNGLSRDQLLRILYVGFVKDAKGYGQQFREANDYDAGTQFWMATQYAITSYTNPSLAEEYFGKYLGPNRGLANQIRAAANDTSIVVPDGSIAYLYQSPGNQPFAAASFPVVQQVQIHGQAMEISLTHEQTTTPPPDTPGVEKGKVVIKKTDDQGNPLQGAKFQIKDQAGNVVQEFTSNGEAQEFLLAPGTYVLQEIEAPAGYQIKGDGKYTFKIKPGTTGVVAPGQEATVVASGTTGGSLFEGTGHMEIGNGLAFCVNPQALFLWEGNGGNTYSYDVLGEGDVDLNAFGTKNSAGARGWIAGAPSNVGLDAAKMEQVKKVLWATYDYAKTGDARKDYTGIIADKIGTVNDRFRQAAVYQAAQVAIAEIVSSGSVNWNAIGDNHTTGNVRTLAQALVTAAAQGQAGYFAAYGGFSIVYLQSDDPATQNLVTPGSETVELTVKNSKTPPPPPPPSDEKVKGKLIVKKVDGAGNFLSGAKFQIEDQAGNVLQEFTTNGEAQEFWLEPGTYVVREVKAPNGHQIKGDGKYTVTITADQLPMTQYVRIWNGGGDSGELNGGYKVAPAGTGENWYPVYCLNVGMPNLNAGGANNSEFPASVGNITRDQALRILYVGQLGDARGYSKQIEAGNGLDKATQWWQTTQYAINFYTNGQTSAFGKHGRFLTNNNMAIANKLIAAANDASIKIPEGTVARLYQHSPQNGREQQPMISASFPKTVEIEVVNEKAPKIGTTATDGTTGDHIGLAAENTVLKDVVAYENLKPGAKYTVKGQLMKRADSSVIEGATAEATFWASRTGKGTVELTFTFDARKLEGYASVAFEELYDVNGTLIAEHKDIKDEGQTVYYPEVKTNATDNGVAGDKVLAPEKTVTVVDKVTYTNLIPGKEYTVSGVLMDKATNKPLVVNGKKVTATKTFTATKKNGSVELKFTFDASALGGKTLVVFETVFYKGKEVAVHADINDVDQTVEISEKPEIGTTAKDSETGKIANADDKVTIVDTVAYSNLVPGKEYTLKGQLVKKSDRKVVATATQKFTPQTESGKVDVTFTFDGSKLAGDSVVAFEELYLGNTLVTDHKDINDKGQTVDFPSAKTTATEGGDHYAVPSGKVTIVDEVRYTNLIPGKKYTVAGVLHDKETGKPLTVEGAISGTTFTADKANGSVKLEFTIDASALKGKAVVAFETVKYEGKTVAVHADINDEEQTVYFPKIRTSAKDGADQDKVVALGEEVTVVDTVTYTNLAVGEEYTVSGVLMDKATNKPLLVNGEKVTASTTFIPEATNGTVDVVFTFNSTALQGDTLVVFEKLYQNGKEVVTHEDINDKGQTVKVEEKPEIEKYVNKNVHKDIDLNEVFTYDVLAYITKDADKAVITDTLNDDLQFVSTAAEVTVVDLGEENDHTPVTGTVSKDGTPVATAKAAIDGQTLTVTIDPATAERGHWVKVTFNAKIADGKNVEDLKYVQITENTPVLTDEQHEGVPNTASYKIWVGNEGKYEDESNTVTVKPKKPEIGTTATVNGEHVIVLGKGAPEDYTIVDTVAWKGLAAGKYVVRGTLMNGENGEAIEIGGAPLTASAEFEVTKAQAAKGKGTVDVEFNVNVTDLFAAAHTDISPVAMPTIKTVVFEQVFAVKGDVVGDTPVATHEDINDEGQTVVFTRQPYDTDVTLQTTATDANDGDKTLEVGSDVTVKDVVSYTGLKVGDIYTLKGKLVVKGTNGQTVVAEAEASFIPETEDGTVEMTFDFNTTGLDGEDLVVYEYLYYGDFVGKDTTLVEHFAKHADDNDKGQTVTVKKENKTPPPTPPVKRTKVKLPVTGLPKTGTPIAVGALTALMLISGGLVLVRRRNS